MADKSFDATKLLKSYQEIEKLAESTVTKAARLNQLKEVEQTLLEKGKTEREVQASLLEKQGELLGKQKDNLTNQQALMNQILEKHQEIVKNGGELNDLQLIYNERAQKNLNITNDRLEVLKKQTTELNKQTTAFERFSKLEKDADRIMSTLFKFKGAEWETTALGSLFKSLSKDGLMASFKSIGSSIMTTINPLNLLGNALVDTIDMFKSFEEARASLVKDTGVAAYGDTLKTVGQQNITLGIKSEGASQALKDLHKEFTDFTTLGAPAQLQLTTFAASMEKLGVSTSVTSANIQIANKVMGMNASQAMKSQKEILSLANQLKVAPQKMAADFQAAMPKLAAWGNLAIDKFKELSVVAKRTGMDINELIDWSAQFDTFEGAADAVGKLNVILGGPLLDSMQMVYMDEKERAQAIKKAVESSGQAFGTMSKQMQQAVTKAAGMKDVATMAKFMSSSFEGVEAAAKAEAASQEKMNKMIEEARPLMDKLMDFARSITALVMPAIDALAWAVDKLHKGFVFLSEYLGQNGAAAFILIIGVVSRFVGILNIIPWLFNKIGISAGLAAMKNFFFAESSATAAAAQGPLAAATTTTGAAMTSASPGVLAFGAGIGLASAGIGLLFWGLSKVIDSLSSFAKESKMSASNVLGLAGALGLFSLSGAAASISLVLLAVGFGALALSLALIKTDDLKAVALMFASISMITTDTIENINSVSSAIKNMAKAMDDLPTDKTIKFTQLLDTTSNMTAEKVGNVKKLVEATEKYKNVTNSTNTNETNTKTTNSNVNTQSSTGTNNNNTRPIILQLDGRVLKKFVMDIVNDEMNPRKI
jgi:hypothetical protein